MLIKLGLVNDATACNVHVLALLCLLVWQGNQQVDARHEGATRPLRNELGASILNTGTDNIAYDENTYIICIDYVATIATCKAELATKTPDRSSKT